jgi:excinuclease UvrABC nuclease subunit
MREAAKKFEFERAAQLRDRIRSLKQKDMAGLFSRHSDSGPDPVEQSSRTVGS